MTIEQDAEVAKVVAGLTKTQRDSLTTLDPDDVCRFSYHPFKGCSQGLFQVAPGWQRMELSPLGRGARDHLLSKGSHDAR